MDLQSRFFNTTKIPVQGMVGRGGVEPPFSDFQSGTPTAYVTCPYTYKTQKEKIVGFEPTTSRLQSQVLYQ